MSVMLSRFTKNVNKLAEIVTVNYELHQYSTHYAIKIFYSDASYPVVRVGQESYIKSLWDDYARGIV